MNTLFPAPTQYGAEFEIAWSAYRYKRGKDEAWGQWRKTGAIRPELALLLICIAEYHSDLKKTKVSQKHFSSWLCSKRWEDFIEEAILRKRIADHPELIPKPRASFQASEYAAPDAATKLTPWKEVLAKHRGEAT